MREHRPEIANSRAAATTVSRFSAQQNPPWSSAYREHLDITESEISLVSIGLGCTVDWLLNRFPEINWVSSCPRITNWFNEFKLRQSMEKHRFRDRFLGIYGCSNCVKISVGKSCPTPADRASRIVIPATTAN